MKSFFLPCHASNGPISILKVKKNIQIKTYRDRVEQSDQAEQISPFHPGT
jgi:hypothetical protein